MIVKIFERINYLDRMFSEGTIMTTINCSSKCKHQMDGKCMQEDAISNVLLVETDCVYFEGKQDKGKSAEFCKAADE